MACTTPRTWSVDNTRDVPAVVPWDPTTDAAERLCYATAGGGECQRADGSTFAWSDASLTPGRTLVVGDASGVHRVLQVPDGLMIRGDGADATLTCSELIGAYTIDGCVGVVASRCAGAMGALLHVRDARGDWSTPAALPSPPVFGTTLVISAARCHAWRGVWTFGGNQALGPSVVTYADGTFSEVVLGRLEVEDAVVDARTGDVVALHPTGAGTNRLVWYRGGEPPVTLAEATTHRVSDDHYAPGLLSFAATSPLDTIVFSENVGGQSFGLFAASFVAGAWHEQRLESVVSAPGTSGAPVGRVWSMARTARGDVLVDMSVGQAPGHVRLRGTCPPAPPSDAR